MNGILTVSMGVARVNGFPLAICGATDPFGAATNFLAGRGFGNGSQVLVTGTPGTVGNTAVFCMTDVDAPAAAVVVAAPEVVEEVVVVAAPAPKRAAKRTKKAPRTSAKKAA